MSQNKNAWYTVSKQAISENIINQCLSCMDHDSPLPDMEEKLEQIKRNIKFRDYESQLLFERAFSLGYAATFLEVEKC